MARVLLEICTTTPNNGDVPVYNSSTGQWEPSAVSGEGATDHGALTGLADDDHSQYHNDTRGDARYYTKGQVDTSLGGKANSTHSHAISDVTGLQTALDGKAGAVIFRSVPLILDPAWTWTNMPVALAFANGALRMVQKVDLTSYTDVRFRVFKAATAGAAASKLILRYITAINTTAANWLNIGTSEVSVATNVQNTFLDTGWIALAADAKADVFITVLGSGGDGALDPIFGAVVAEFR